MRASGWFNACVGVVQCVRRGRSMRASGRFNACVGVVQCVRRGGSMRASEWFNACVGVVQCVRRSGSMRASSPSRRVHGSTRLKRTEVEPAAVFLVYVQLFSFSCLVSLTHIQTQLLLQPAHKTTEAKLARSRSFPPTTVAAAKSFVFTPDWLKPKTRFTLPDPKRSNMFGQYGIVPCCCRLVLAAVFTDSMCGWMVMHDQELAPPPSSAGFLVRYVACLSAILHSLFVGTSNCRNCGACAEFAYPLVNNEFSNRLNCVADRLLINLSSTKPELVALSLDGLLDYTIDDKNERTFEVSLFAEFFKEMLQRDYGTVVAAALHANLVSPPPPAAAAAATDDKDLKRKRTDDDEASSSKRAKESKESAAVEPKAQPMDQEATAASTEGKTETTSEIKPEQPADVAKEAAAENGTAAAAEVKHDANADQTNADEPKADDSKPKTRIEVDSAVQHAFEYFDSNFTGYLRNDDVESLLWSLGRNYSKHYVKEVVAAASENRKVTYKKLFEKVVPE
eukprot:TRINITY_DN4035_c0_g1_i7.p1 TRINITY_DN4035_c0_g1~~TRINITY_DN4035_c0_g1_i7.p1  ORF type:complete len:517 (-),score=56.67 TRINITY_DN4035_c0_g1_i7:183-1709(-)